MDLSSLQLIEILLKVGIPFIIFILSAIGKFLWDIKTSSSNTTKEVHSLKEEVKSELTALKFKVDNLDSKIKDYYSRAESDNRLLQLENKLIDRVYSLINRSRNTKTTKPAQ